MYYLEIDSSAPDRPLLADTQLNTHFADKTIQRYKTAPLDLFLFFSTLYSHEYPYIYLSLFSPTNMRCMHTQKHAQGLIHTHTRPPKAMSADLVGMHWPHWNENKLTTVS